MKCNLILTGGVLAGHSREAVAAGLAQLLKVPKERALALLAGRETVLKRDVERVALAPYVEALRRVGAEVRIDEPPAPAPAVETVKCPACGAEQPRFITFYRSSPWVELPVFLILTLGWAVLAAVDRKGAGGTITLTPRVDEGVISWNCATAGVHLSHVGEGCK